MPFEEVIGQEKTIRTLRNALIQGTFPHAYLFYGSRGVGKYKVAISFAKAILCGRREADFCGTCSACRRIEEGNHPDVLFVRPGVTKQGEGWYYDPDNGTIQIGQVRDVQRWISVRSFEGGYKIAIFEGAERMNSPAANALLKVLEEPPLETLLILISPTKTQLPPTMTSRCQKIYFPPLSKEALQRVLEHSLEGSREEGMSSLMVALAEGSVGKAMSMDMEWVHVERRRWIEKLISVEEGRSKGEIPLIAEEISSSDRVQEILDTFRAWYRDVLVFKETREVSRLLNEDMKDRIVDLAERRTAEDCITRIRDIRNAMEDIGNRINPRLALENLLVGMQCGAF